MAENNKPVIIEQSFNASFSKVWKAISGRDEMKQWYFNLEEFKPEPGFEFRFSSGENEKKQYLHICKIVEAVPDKKLSYSWKYDGYEGNSLVSFELFSDAGKTKLRLTHSGLETFPQSNPDFAKENFVKGWTQIIGTSLKEFLEKN